MCGTQKGEYSNFIYIRVTLFKINKPYLKLINKFSSRCWQATCGRFFPLKRLTQKVIIPNITS